MVVTHHAALRQDVFETADRVRVAVLMTDGLGFAFVPPVRDDSLSDLRSLLYEVQYRFDPHPEAVRARITARLDSFD